MAGDAFTNSSRPRVEIVKFPAAETLMSGKKKKKKVDERGPDAKNFSVGMRWATSFAEDHVMPGDADP